MNNLQERKLIVKIVQYFRSKILSEQLGPDQVESLEVALQCLESTFNVNLSDPALQTDVNLLELFSANVKEKTPTESDKALAESLKNEGNELMKQEKYEDAIQKYTEAIQLSTNPIFFCNRAAAYSKVDRQNDAVEDCKIALQLDPSYSKAYGRMGLAYSSMNKYKEARDAYKHALDLEPSNDSFRNNLSIAEEKVRESESQPGGGAAGFPGFPNFAGAPNFMEMLNNPTFNQMAQQLMADPSMINMMGNLFGMPGQAPPPPPNSATPGSQSNLNADSGANVNPNEAGFGQPMDGSTPQPASFSNLLEMGQRFASMMQQQNPELVEQLRRQFQGQNNNSNNNQPQDPHGGTGN